MQQLREQIQQIGSHDAAVLFIGENGTGREAFARYLHSIGSRAGQPFVVVAGGALEDGNVLERLHGREVDGEVQPGLYDEARGGTLYLAGLEDFSSVAQRVIAADLDAGGYMRVGSSRSQPLDVRVISGAQPGIELRHNPEAFRRDLLAHLSLITLKVPPLRDYAEDVPELLRHYIDRLVEEQRLPLRRFGVAAQNRLRNYPWPGNMSELKNLVHRLLLIGGDEEIRLDEIERELAAQHPKDEPLVKQDLLALPLREAREAFERAYLQQQLILCNGKVGQLAKRVGMERTHLYRKLRSLGIDFRQGADD
jgi:DNA-binding NtrC family response regulator